MRYIFAAAVFVLLIGCARERSAPPPEDVVVTGDTARVPVFGSADVQGGEMENIRWKDPETTSRTWLKRNGFRHRFTTFDTERMQAIGYENFVSEDQTGVRLYGISVWTRAALDR